MAVVLSRGYPFILSSSMNNGVMFSVSMGGGVVMSSSSMDISMMSSIPICGGGGAAKHFYGGCYDV